MPPKDDWLFRSNSPPPPVVAAAAPQDDIAPVLVALKTELKRMDDFKEEMAKSVDIAVKAERERFQQEKAELVKASQDQILQMQIGIQQDIAEQLSVLKLSALKPVEGVDDEEPKSKPKKVVRTPSPGSGPTLDDLSAEGEAQDNSSS